MGAVAMVDGGRLWTRDTRWKGAADGVGVAMFDA
jgi:hypothetical protein